MREERVAQVVHERCGGGGGVGCGRRGGNGGEGEGWAGGGGAGDVVGPAGELVGVRVVGAVGDVCEERVRWKDWVSAGGGDSVNTAKGRIERTPWRLLPRVLHLRRRSLPSLPSKRRRLPILHRAQTARPARRLPRRCGASSDGEGAAEFERAPAADPERRAEDGHRCQDRDCKIPIGQMSAGGSRDESVKVGRANLLLRRLRGSSECGGGGWISLVGGGSGPGGRTKAQGGDNPK